MAKHIITKSEAFEAILIIGKLLGLSRSVATIFAILYSHDDSLSIEELVEISGLSKSAVSLALRDLAQLGAVQEKGVVGERSRRYGGQPNLAHVVTEIVVSRLKYPLSELRDKVDTSQEAHRRLHQVQFLLNTFDHTLATLLADNQPRTQ
jgi:DNA-binding transcriptional regulator GbsR (MarR family)